MTRLGWLLCAAMAMRLVHCVSSANLRLLPLAAQTYQANQMMTIQWESAGTDRLTIDLVADQPAVLLESYTIATGIDGALGKYAWKVSPELVSGSGYHVRIYSAAQNKPPSDGDSSFSASFSIYNHFPRLQSSLTVIEPSGSADGQNLESRCLLGETCSIVWDYPDWAASGVASTVDVRLYRVGNPLPLLVLAHGIPTSQKSITWQVPGDSWLKSGGPVFVAVVGSGAHLIGPGMSTYRAATGFPFQLETRTERDERHAGQPHESVDFTAPGPITAPATSIDSGSSFIDVPRPTYAPVAAENKGTVTSGAGSKVFGLTLMLLNAGITLAWLL